MSLVPLTHSSCRVVLLPSSSPHHKPTFTTLTRFTTSTPMSTFMPMTTSASSTEAPRLPHQLSMRNTKCDTPNRRMHRSFGLLPPNCPQAWYHYPPGRRVGAFVVGHRTDHAVGKSFRVCPSFSSTNSLRGRFDTLLFVCLGIQGRCARRHI